MDEMTKKRIGEDIARQADANEMRKRIDLIILTLEASRSALLKEEVKPMPNPLGGDDAEIGEAMIQADALRRQGERDGAAGALSYAVELLRGIITQERKRDI